MIHQPFMQHHVPFEEWSPCALHLSSQGPLKDHVPLALLHVTCRPGGNSPLRGVCQSHRFGCMHCILPNLNGKFIFRTKLRLP
jgi:hypothetical protein